MSNILFTPIQGNDSQIQKIEYNEGYVYFALDTGKIYLDANDENKILMGGGGASLLYANDTSVDSLPDDTYVLSLDTLEDASNLKENDLIINQGDGGFYKVKSINASSNSVICYRIAVSGTGGGGGGVGPGPGPGGSSTLQVEVSGIANYQTFVFGRAAEVTVKATAELDSTITVIYEIISSTGTKAYTDELTSGYEKKFDIGSKLQRGTNKVVIYFQSNNSGSDQRSYSNLNAVEMSLLATNALNPARVIGVDERVLNFSVTGAGLSKTVEAFIDNIPIFKQNIPNNSTIAVTLPGAKFEGASNNDTRQTHGVHEVKVTMYADANGRKINVDDLIYEFAWAEPGVTTPIIWFGNKPDVVTNYSVASIEYMVYDPSVAEGRTFEIELLKEGIKLPESPKTIAYDSTKMLTWNISNYDIGTNEYSITRSGVRKDFTLVAEADSNRNMEISDTNLYLSLDSKGRSNNEASYNRNKWSFTNKNGKEFNPDFIDFNWYNNGWIEDESNVSALRISNGAKLDIPLSDILKTSALSNSYTFEFQFNIKNVQNYITMVNTSTSEGEGTGEDKDNDGIEDTEAVDSSTIRSDWKDIAFADFYANGVGFAFGPSDFFMSGGGALAYARYKENSLINVSIVIEQSEKLIYLYINGVMSQIKKCDPSKDFSNTTSYLSFYPSNCDLDLYKVRVYNRALNYAEVVQNLLADLKDVQTYDANQVTRIDAYGNQTIDLIALQSYNAANPDNPSMPYAILKINDDKATQLPYIKGGKVNCDITFVNPALDRAYETGELAKKAQEARMSVEDYYTRHCPSFFKIQGQVDVQGTSSQGYPRRNYKLKCKPSKYGGSWVMNKGPFGGVDENGNKKEKEITGMYLDNARKEPTFTWKADYMESSGTHNTGLTSYVKTLYDKHPLADYYDPSTIEDYDDLRTTIYGFPMLVFEEKADGSYEFIGKYNFNLDKDCPNVTGMEFDRTHPILTDKKMADVCECWEMGNNKGTRTAFKTLNYDEIVGEVKDEETGEITIDYSLTLPEDIEYRYLAKGDDLEDLLDNPSPDNNVKALEYYKNIQDLAEWLYWLDTDPNPEADNALGSELTESIVIENVTYTHDTKEYRLAKFKKEFSEHFDLEYMLIYFIVTELLVLYDSRGKNMMLATWGPQQVGGNYIWYPIFYDVDTQLGIDNSGVPLWDYDVNPSDDRVFSTPGSVMWNNFYSQFLTQIKNKYAELRKTKLNFENLNGYYDFNPAVSGSYAMKGIRPYVAYNADAFFKYIAPSKPNYGYVTTEGKTAYTDTYYYCAQGTRELQRELFLTNRFYYLDSKWQAGDFSYNNINSLVQLRLNSNDKDETSDSTWGNENYPNEYDTLNYFNITPFLNSHIGLFTDSTPSLSSRVIKAGQSANLSVKRDIADKIQNVEKGNQGQLIYLCGKSYVSSYGDLSKYYLNELDLNGATRLTDMLLGSDLENYKNNFFKADAKIVFDETDGYPLLREANFSRLNRFSKVVNLFKSDKLENFRALGSGITELQVPKGVQLKICYLPKTINEINFTEAKQLTKILRYYPYKDSKTGWPEGLYIEGLTNKLSIINDSSTTPNDVAVGINTFYLDGGFLGTDAYEILEGLVDIKLRMDADWINNTNLNKKLSVNALNMNWSPFEKLEAGTPYDAEEKYFKTTDSYELVEYIYGGTKDWEKNTLNGLIYKQVYEPTTSPITDLSLLDKLIDGYNGNFYGTVEGTIAYVSGDIYVNNTADTPIKEVDIQNKYLVSYPELTIHAAYTAPAITVNYYEESEDGILTQWGPQKYSMPIGSDSDEWNLKVQKLSKTPVKNHYDFMGWSLSKTATEPDEKQPTDYTLADVVAAANGGTSLTFWAVYHLHAYTITFKNDDGSSLSADPEVPEFTMSVYAGDYLSVPNIIPWKDDSKLGKEQTYKFKGWLQKQSSSGNEQVLDLTTIKASKDLTFYAYYGLQESVYNVIYEDYFVKRGPLEYRESNPNWGNAEFNKDGIILGLARPVKGKVTIPTKFKGETVVALDRTFGGYDSRNNTDGLGGDITYVFFQPDSEVREFQSYCFSYNDNLKQVLYPNKLRRIGDRAFSNCTNLTLLNDTIGNNVVSISQNAFNSAFGPDQKTIYIGSGVKQLDYYSFANLRAKLDIYIGSESDLSQLDFDNTTNGANGYIIFAASLEQYPISIYSYTEKRYTKNDILAMCRGDFVDVIYANGD